MERRLALLRYIRAQSDPIPEAAMVGWMTEQIRYAVFAHYSSASGTRLSPDVLRAFEDTIASIETYDLEESMNASGDAE